MISLQRTKKLYIIFAVILLSVIFFQSPLKPLAADNIGPSVTIQSVSHNTENTLFTVTGRLSDDTSSAENIKIQFIDAVKKITAITPNADGTWTLDVPNVDGAFIKATDEANNTRVISVKDTVRPSIKVTDIAPNVDQSKTVVSGLVSDDQTLAENINLKLVSTDGTVISNIVSPDSKGAWSFEADSITGLYIKATDDSSKSKMIPLEISRPFINSIRMKVFDPKANSFSQTIDIMADDDLTRVKKDTTVTIEVSDNYFVKDFYHITSPITISNGTGKISSYYEKDNNLYLVFHFDEILVQSKTYFIMHNSLNSTENDMFPLMKKFTTVSDTVFNTDLDKQSYSADWEHQPHGYFNNNVNTCSNCHDTHESSNPGLTEASYSTNSKIDSYCMACHDGTTTAPMMGNYQLDLKSQHNAQLPLADATKKTAGSCASCHNPHLNWSSDNPNLLKDHYVYTHKDTGYPDNQTVGTIDSNVQLCESCHGKNTKAYKERAETEGDAYKTLRYRKSSSTGKPGEDYDLCFSCHDGSKTGISDIKTPFTNPSSLHNIPDLTGSPLRYVTGITTAPLGCSECHETHGSSNLTLLKSKLGHENQESDFSFTAGKWEDNERIFCMKCHNGKTTTYGVTATLDPLKSTGHSSMELCSSCHGYGVNKTLTAAHGPITNKTAPLTQVQVQTIQTTKETPNQSTTTSDTSNINNETITNNSATDLGTTSETYSTSSDTNNTNVQNP